MQHPSPCLANTTVHPKTREWIPKSFEDFLQELHHLKRIVESAACHLSLLNLYLLRFGVLAHPSAELQAAAHEHGLDPWFEFLKRLQQYPEEDGFFLKGTNLIDWTQSPDVALYFANDMRIGEGAIYVCDATATGKTLQVIP